MTNQEKFIEIMNDVFDAGFTKENMDTKCSPCGALKKFDAACKGFSCKGCRKWWNKEYCQRTPKAGILNVGERTINQQGDRDMNNPKKENKIIGAGVGFERIRRITGYLVGTIDRWNNSKRAEERDRVKHGVECENGEADR